MMGEEDDMAPELEGIQEPENQDIGIAGTSEKKIEEVISRLQKYASSGRSVLKIPKNEIMEILHLLLG